MTVAEHPFAPEDVMACVDGALPPAQEAEVRAHLAACAACQAVAVDVRGVSRALARWVVEDAPATLVSSRIVPPRRRPIDRLNAWLWRPGSQLGLGAAMLVVLAWAMTVDRHQGKLLMGPELASSPAAVSSPRASEAGSSLPPLPDDARAMALAVDEADARVSARTVVARQVPPLPSPAIARTARLRLRTGDFDKVRSDIDRVLTELRSTATRFLNGYVPSAAGPRSLDELIVAPGLGERSGIVGAITLAEAALT